MMRRLAVTCIALLWPIASWALPTGYYSWTNTASPTTDTFSGQWEDSPTGGEAASLGDNRLRQLKMNIRLRSNAELCWDATTSSGCGVVNSGRLRLGSARPFLQNTTPTVLSTADATGSTALDTARLWIDTNGADNNSGTEDDNYRLSVHIGSNVWKDVLAMGKSGTTVNDFKLWDGNSWANAPLSATTLSTGTSSDAVNTAVPTVLTDMGMSPGNPAVTIPSTGDYIIHVSAQVSIAAGTTNVWVGLVEGDGSTTPVVRECNIQIASGIGQCNFDYYKDSPTLSATYTYKLQILAAAAGAFYNAESVLALANGINNKATIQVVRTSKSLPQGF